MFYWRRTTVFKRTVIPLLLRMWRLWRLAFFLFCSLPSSHHSNAITYMCSWLFLLCSDNLSQSHDLQDVYLLGVRVCVCPQTVWIIVPGNRWCVCQKRKRKHGQRNETVLLPSFHLELHFSSLATRVGLPEGESTQRMMMMIMMKWHVLQACVCVFVLLSSKDASAKGDP